MNARDKIKAQLRASQTELRRLEQTDAARRLAKAREDKGFAEAERALAKANIALASARARGESTSKLETGLQKAQAAYDSALKRLGADVSVHYRCDKCRDIGFDKDGEPCDCVKAQFIDMLKAECGAHNIPPFTFADDRSATLDCSQKEELGLLYTRFKQFCAGFDTTSVKVIFLCGKPGIGKSSLAYAAANELLSLGKSVCFMTAFEFNNAMLKYHTSPLAARASIMEPVTDSDLLVIDDLGTENVLRNVTCEYLYNVIDTRISRGKRTIVTSNLAPEALMARYGERTISRMLNKSYAKSYVLNGDNLRLRSASL